MWTQLWEEGVVAPEFQVSGWTAAPLAGAQGGSSLKPAPSPAVGAGTGVPGGGAARCPCCSWSDGAQPSEPRVSPAVSRDVPSVLSCSSPAHRLLAPTGDSPPSGPPVSAADCREPGCACASEHGNDDSLVHKHSAASLVMFLRWIPGREISESKTGTLSR